MTILGILAAIVSISLLGVTGNARAKASSAEKVIVQSAMDEMLSDQQVSGSDPITHLGPIADACDGSFHKDMTTWPGVAPAHPGAAYGGPGSTNVTVLASHYLRQGATKWSYACDADGKVTQGP